MRRLRISVAAAAALAVLALAPGVYLAPQAQTLTTGLFDRYLDALRQEHGIPGLSAAIVQNGSVVWSRGFGSADVASSTAARPDTPYPVADLTQTIGATLLLRHCVDFGSAELTDRVVRWSPFAEPSATLQQVLEHVRDNGYQYDPARFGALAPAVSECAKQPYTRLVAQLLDQLAMTRSVPGREAVQQPDAALFSASTLDRYDRVLQQMATPYRVGSTRVASRSDVPSNPISASTGLISTVEDLAKFDIALNGPSLLSPESRDAAWELAQSRPTGLGWFVQANNGEKIVWHFGVATDAYSSLIIKLPARGLTFIALANSDGLGSRLSTAQPNVTQSLFARLFLQFFGA